MNVELIDIIVNSVFNLIWLSITIGVLISIIRVYRLYNIDAYKQYRRSKIISQYDIIGRIIDEAREIAYKKIWQENMAKHSANGFKLSNEDVVTYRRKFVKHTLSFCGSAIQQDLILLHGDLDAAVLTLITWFDTRINNDELLVLNTAYTGNSGKNGDSDE